MRTPIKAEMHTVKSILSLNILMTNVTVLPSPTVFKHTTRKLQYGRVAQCFFIGLAEQFWRTYEQSSAYKRPSRCTPCFRKYSERYGQVEVL
jgi:hypothetical protein